MRERAGRRPAEAGCRVNGEPAEAGRRANGDPAQAVSRPNGIPAEGSCRPGGERPEPRAALQAARVRVPASTSNLGAGFDCIGLALDRGIEAEYVPGAGALRVERSGTLAGLELGVGEDFVARAFTAELARRGVAGAGGVLRVSCDAPLARGLGTSAAAVVAGLALGAAAVGARGLAAGANPAEATDPARSAIPAGAANPAGTAGRGASGIAGFDRAAALAEAAGWEGHPDNAAPALYGGLVAVVGVGGGRFRALRQRLSPAIEWAFAAPGVEVSTRRARAALPGVVAHGVAAAGVGRVAALLRGLAEADGELLAAGFEDELHVPYRLALIPGGTAALGAAVEAGAWAATVSGSGSGLIAACPAGRAAGVAAAMAAALGAAEGAGEVVAFTTMPDPDGLRFLDARPAGAGEEL